MGVESEYSSWQEICPVILSFSTEETHEGFNFLVLVLNFTITFGVISGSDAGFNAEVLVEYLYNPCSKLQTLIRVNLSQKTIEAKNILIVDVLSVFCSKGIMHEHKVNLVRVVINNDCN